MRRLRATFHAHHHCMLTLSVRPELSSDTTIRTHLSALYDTLLEQNLLRIVEPYSVVEIEYIAQQVGQGRQAVELKLSQMILDKIFHGVLDQGRGCLLIFDQPEADVRIFPPPFWLRLTNLLNVPEDIRRGDRYAGAGRQGRRFAIRKGMSP